MVAPHSPNFAWPPSWSQTGAAGQAPGCPWMEFPRPRGPVALARFYRRSSSSVSLALPFNVRRQSPKARWRGAAINLSDHNVEPARSAPLSALGRDFAGRNRTENGPLCPGARETCFGGSLERRWVRGERLSEEQDGGWKFCHAAGLQAVSRASFASPASTAIVFRRSPSVLIAAGELASLTARVSTRMRR